MLKCCIDLRGKKGRVLDLLQWRCTIVIAPRVDGGEAKLQAGMRAGQCISHLPALRDGKPRTPGAEAQ